MVDTEDPTGAVMVKEDLGRTMCMSSEVHVEYVPQLVTAACSPLFTKGEDTTGVPELSPNDRGALSHQVTIEIRYMDTVEDKNLYDLSK